MEALIDFRRTLPQRVFATLHYLSFRGCVVVFARPVLSYNNIGVLVLIIVLVQVLVAVAVAVAVAIIEVVAAEQRQQQQQE